jgi:hypothetical protein
MAAKIESRPVNSIRSGLARRHDRQRNQRARKSFPSIQPSLDTPVQTAFL